MRFHHERFGGGRSPVDFWSREAISGGTIVCAESWRSISSTVANS